ncbi:MAG: murein biosynthesis integral membrane protein MurJ [Spiribacter sp.]|jgi:putative peptidoglycan lipid II flippase|nr:murein biosynthesis integral membrane protein MurJ [Spiribacter sp.]MDR9489060.1 murein biosynthesis integral membrane protein MurJ [Spiribacter sp.]
MQKGLLQSVMTFGSWTMLSRVLGLARDVVLGVVFGPSAATDAFFVAFKIPNFLRRLFAEGAFQQAFVPVLAQVRETGGDSAVRALYARVTGCLALVLLAITAAAILGSPLLIRGFAPGFIDQPEQLVLASDMLRVTFPYLLLIALTAAAAAVLNTYGSFGPPAFAPVLLNLCLIAAAVWLAPQLNTGVMALALAVPVAGLLQLALQLPFLWRRGLLRRPRLDWKDSGVRRILRLMGPTLFSTSVQQINLLLDTILASFLVVGSISWLYWSDRLMEFPLGVFGIALGTVILPRLSSAFSTTNTQQFSATLDWSLRITLVLILPAAVGLVVLANPLLTTLFQYGRFTTADVSSAGWSLMAYGAGLFAFVLVKVLVPGYFSRQNTRGPVRCAIIAMAVNMLLSISLVITLMGTGVAHAGLALATSIAAWVNAGLLYRGLRREKVYTPQSGWAALLWRSAAAVLVMAVVLAWPAGQSAFWFGQGVLGRVISLTGLIVVGASVYFLTLWLLGIRPHQFKEPTTEHG